MKRASTRKLAEVGGVEKTPEKKAGAEGATTTLGEALRRMFTRTPTKKVEEEIGGSRNGRQMKEYRSVRVAGGSNGLEVEESENSMKKRWTVNAGAANLGEKRRTPERMASKRESRSVEREAKKEMKRMQREAKVEEKMAMREAKKRNRQSVSAPTTPMKSIDENKVIGPVEKTTALTAPSTSRSNEEIEALLEAVRDTKLHELMPPEVLRELNAYALLKRCLAEQERDERQWLKDNNLLSFSPNDSPENSGRMTQNDYDKAAASTAVAVVEPSEKNYEAVTRAEDKVSSFWQSDAPHTLKFISLMKIGKINLETTLETKKPIDINEFSSTDLKGYIPPGSTASDINTSTISKEASSILKGYIQSLNDRSANTLSKDANAISKNSSAETSAIVKEALMLDLHDVMASDAAPRSCSDCSSLTDEMASSLFAESARRVSLKNLERFKTADDSFSALRIKCKARRVLFNDHATATIEDNYECIGHFESEDKEEELRPVVDAIAGMNLSPELDAAMIALSSAMVRESAARDSDLLNTDKPIEDRRNIVSATQSDGSAGIAQTAATDDSNTAVVPHDKGAGKWSPVNPDERIMRRIKPRDSRDNDDFSDEEDDDKEEVVPDCSKTMVLRLPLRDAAKADLFEIHADDDVVTKHRKNEARRLFERKQLYVDIMHEASSKLEFENAAQVLNFLQRVSKPLDQIQVAVTTSSYKGYEALIFELQSAGFFKYVPSFPSLISVPQWKTGSYA